MYKVIFRKDYTVLVFRFKEFIDASCFMKSALESSSGDFSITVELEPDGKEGDE